MNKKDRAVEGPEGRETKTTAKNHGQRTLPRSVAKTVLSTALSTEKVQA